MNITYQVEDYLQCLPELKDCYPEHFEELAADKKDIPLNPDYETYAMMAKAGVLHLVTVRVDGVLVGYHLSMIDPHLHYKQSLTCFTDIFLIRKPYRHLENSLIGLKLFKFMEESVKQKGVQRIYMGTKLHMDIDPILNRLGYNPKERLYTKVIG